MLKLNEMLGAVAVFALLAAPAFAQTRPPEKPTPRPQPEQPRPEAASPAPVAAPRPDPQGPAVNVKLDLTITDQTGPGEPTKKLVTMFVADRQSGSIRTLGSIRDSATGTWRNVTINVDARPFVVLEGGRSTGFVRVELGLEYQPTAGPDKGTAPIPASLNQRITVYVENGKPVTISQAADPISDRRISVELKATVLK